MPIYLTFYFPYKILLIVFSKIKGCFEFKYTTQSENKDNLLALFLIFTLTILLSYCIG